MKQNKKRTAFVFAGGGSLGAIQVGSLRELVKWGERPDFLVGASFGALNACFFAGSPDQNGVTALESIWRGLHRREVFPLTFSSMVNLLRGRGSLFDSSRLRNLIERNIPMQLLENAKVPVHVVATNLGGAPITFSSGPAVDAVLVNRHPRCRPASSR